MSDRIRLFIAGKIFNDAEFLMFVKNNRIRLDEINKLFPIRLSNLFLPKIVREAKMDGQPSGDHPLVSLLNNLKNIFCEIDSNKFRSPISIIFYFRRLC